jgi:hypothetical protein
MIGAETFGKRIIRTSAFPLRMARSTIATACLIRSSDLHHETLCRR